MTPFTRGLISTEGPSQMGRLQKFKNEQITA